MHVLDLREAKQKARKLGNCLFGSHHAQCPGSDAASHILLQEQRNAVARFLDAREMKQEALDIATDPDYRFDLAVSLGKLGIALELAEQSGSELKWRQLGELALSAGKLQVQPPSLPLLYLY